MKSQNKSILFLGTQMTRAGAQEVLLTQAEWFNKKGYRVNVIFFYDKQKIHSTWQKKYGFKITNLWAWKEKGTPLDNIFRLSLGILRLSLIMIQNRFDLIETFTPHPNIIGLPLAWIFRIPIRVATHHGQIEGFPQWQSYLHRWIINSGLATCLITVSNYIKKDVIENDSIDANKIINIENGINFSILEKDLSGGVRRKIRNELNVDQQGHFILTVGRLTKQKGHLCLLDAIPNVLNHYPDTTFAIAGDGFMMPKLKEKAYELAIHDSIRFLGLRSDIPQLLYTANIFVLPSIWEGLSIALLEAMAVQVPVIASHIEGNIVIIENEINGLLFPPGDSDSLATAIIRLLNDENERKRLGIAGQDLVKAKYTVDRMCDQYEYLFYQLQDGKRDLENITQHFDSG